MKVDKYHYPIIILATFVGAVVLAMMLGLTPAH